MSFALSYINKFIFSGMIDMTMIPVLVEQVLFFRRRCPQNEQTAFDLVSWLLYSSLPHPSSALITTMVKGQAEIEMPPLSHHFMAMVESNIIQSQRNSWTPQLPYWTEFMANPNDWRCYVHQLKVVEPFDTQFEFEEFGYEYNFLDNEKRYYMEIKPKLGVQKQNFRAQQTVAPHGTTRKHVHFA